MKIAHVCPFYTPAIGGVKQVVEELAKRQIKAGHEVHVFTSDWDKEKRIKEKYEIIDKVHVHRCRHLFKIANFVTIWPSVFSELMKHNFDIIHSHVFGHPHFVFASLAAKIKNTPHIHTTHCTWTDAYRSSAGRLGAAISYNFFSRIALKFTKKIIAITPWEFSFIKKYGGKQAQIINLPNGMDEIFFNKIKPNDFKTKHKIKPTDKIVLFFGRLNITKRPDNFVRIAKLILKKIRQQKKDNLTFVICGPDEGLQQKVKQLIGNEKKILLLPPIRNRHEVAKMYQSAELYVLPSYREGLPLTIFEAMASGLPIVASPVNGVPFEIKDKENGFLIPYNNLQKYKDKILQLLDDDELRQKISKNNLKKARAYDWDVIFERMMGVYGDAVGKTLKTPNS